MNTPDLHLAGVVDPARYSDRARVVFEVEPDAYNKMSDHEIDVVKDALEDELGMKALILVGVRLARIEEPDDDVRAD